MNRECASVRKKGSTDKCKLPALANHTLCRIHARSKIPVLWTSLVPQSNITQFQALVRGWTVRKYLKLCGPGVLHRSILANDEDLVSCESKETQYPIEFFSFEENGKVWWFDFDTIWTWCMKSPNPENPYTKVPLSTQTRKRLRELWAYRKIHQMHIPSESNMFQERIRNRWNIMTQVFEDNRFGYISPEQFEDMTAEDYHVVSQFVESDLQVSMKKTNIYFKAFMRLLGISIRNYESMNPIQYILQSSHVLLILLCLPKDPYIPAFTLLSALRRM